MLKKLKKVIKLSYLLFFGSSKYKKDYKSSNILIYQMGKVGSSSLEKGIPNSIHLHSLDGLSNKYFVNDYTERLNIVDFASEKLKWKLKQKAILDKINKREKVKIITLVRDPIARNVSSFFQPIKTQNREFSESRFFLQMNHFTPLYWFQNEIHKNLGINIFDYPFDKEKGYTLINHQNIEILVLKLEKLHSNTQAIRDFINDPKFVLSHDNVGNEKWYAKEYQKFKNNFTPSKNYINMLYNSKYTKHFYTESEINEFIKKWEG